MDVVFVLVANYSRKNEWGIRDMKCSNCNHPIEEPLVTHLVDCPNCNHMLLVPSRRDWLAMRADSSIRSLID